MPSSITSGTEPRRKAINDAGKGDLLRGAAALLFPINWPEPFGLVMIEAMACGTPVIMPEDQQLFCEPGYDPLRPTIQFGRHSLGKRSDLGNTHGLSWMKRLKIVASVGRS
jgi:Glycosyl transferases group 1